jgi:hypothetical protein
LSEEEITVISGGDGDYSDRLGKEGVNLLGEVDIDVVRSLYRRGLIYLDVPVYPDDHFQGASCLSLWTEPVLFIFSDFSA